ncbi:MAG: phosphotransferase, partial [Chloroflexi bacterium]|nr:phosphotransferase [Chloroflexota bacterium]
FTTIIGAELHAPMTALGEKWHILALGLPLDFARTGADETAAAIARRANAAGAFIALAHPAWYGLTLQDMQSIDAAHAVEIYNHRSSILTSRGDSTSHVDQLHASGSRLGLIAADDAHFKTDDSLGGFVMVKAQANTPDFLVDSLKSQQYYASQGPLISDVVWRDDEVEVSCSPVRVVMVLSKGSRAVYETGHDISKITLPLKRVRSYGYGRIVVIDDDGHRAWTNAVWW